MAIGFRYCCEIKTPGVSSGEQAGAPSSADLRAEGEEEIFEM